MHGCMDKLCSLLILVKLYVALIMKDMNEIVANALERQGGRDEVTETTRFVWMIDHFF